MEKIDKKPLKKGDLIEIEIKGFREEECCKYLQRAFQEVL